MVIKTSYSYKEHITPEFFLNFSPSKLVDIDEDKSEIVLSSLVLPDSDIVDKLIKLLLYLEESYSLSGSFNIEDDGVLINPTMSTLLLTSELSALIENFDIYGEKVLNRNKIASQKCTQKRLKTVQDCVLKFVKRFYDAWGVKIVYKGFFKYGNLYFSCIFVDETFFFSIN